MQPFWSPQGNPNNAIPYVAASPAHPTAYGAQPIPVTLMQQPTYFAPPQNSYYPQPTYLIQAPQPQQFINPYDMGQPRISVPQNSSVLYSRPSTSNQNLNTSNTVPQQNYLYSSPRLNSSSVQTSRLDQNTDLSDPEIIRQQIKEIHIASPRANLAKTLLRKSLTSPSPSSVSSSASLVPYIPSEFRSNGSRQTTATKQVDEDGLFDRRTKRKLETHKVTAPNFSDDEIYEEDRRKRNPRQPVASSSRYAAKYSSSSDHEDVIEQTKRNQMRRERYAKQIAKRTSKIAESDDENDDVQSQNSVVNRIIATQTVEIPDSPIQQIKAARSISPLLFNQEEDEEEEVLIDARPQQKPPVIPRSTQSETTTTQNTLESKAVPSKKNLNDRKSSSTLEDQERDKTKKTKQSTIAIEDNKVSMRVEEQHIISKSQPNSAASKSSQSLSTNVDLKSKRNIEEPEKDKISDSDKDKSAISVYSSTSKASSSSRKTAGSLDFETGLGGFSDESTLSSILSKPLKPTFIAKSKFLTQKQPIQQIIVESDDENEEESLSKKPAVVDSSIDESDREEDLNEQQKVDEEQAIELYKWWVKFIYRVQNNTVDIFVYGLKDDKSEWNSSSLVNRLSKREVASAKTKYCLIGGCDEKKFNANNAVHFSRMFLRKFYDGFPSDWRDVIAEEADRIKGQVAEQAKQKSTSSAASESHVNIYSQAVTDTSRSKQKQPDEVSKSKKVEQPKEASSSQSKEQTSSKENKQPTQDDEPIIKRKRGRPKKNEALESKSKKQKKSEQAEDYSPLAAVEETEQPTADEPTQILQEVQESPEGNEEPRHEDDHIEFSNEVGGFDNNNLEDHNFSQEVFPELSNPEVQNQFSLNDETVQDSDEEPATSSQITTSKKDTAKNSEKQKKSIKKKPTKKDEEKQSKSSKKKVGTKSISPVKESKKRKSSSSETKLKTSPAKRRRKSSRIQEHSAFVAVESVLVTTTKSGRACMQPKAYWAGTADYITPVANTIRAQKHGAYSMVVKSEPKQSASKSAFRTIELAEPIEAEEQDFLSQGEQPQRKTKQTDKSLTRTLDTVLHTDELDPLIDIL